MSTSIAKSPSNDVFARPIYTPGDGEVRGAVRPGSQDALEIPSLFANKRIYRDGRVVHLPSDDTEGGEV